MNTRMILIGGFLGAGKTTLLWIIADLLGKQGERVGLITNDQASELVDTSFLSKAGQATMEVSGSCFCCNFEGFTKTIRQLREEFQAEVILAEPVGSCTDLSATIIQPLKEMLKDEVTVLPLNVLVDPGRLTAILNGTTSGLHRSAAYIVCKQMEEADYIVINKSDLLSEEEKRTLQKRTSQKWPLAKVYAISTITGEGIVEWLEDVSKDSLSGTHLADIDYDIYAEGEAVLGWLNATVQLEGKGADWKALLENLMISLSRCFDQREAAVGHVKLMMEAGQEYIIGNLTGKADTLCLRGQLGEEDKVCLTINARVELTPQVLEEIIRKQLNAVFHDGVQYDIMALTCLQPGRPNPTFRYEVIV